MAIRKPIVIVDGNHLSELPAGDSLMAHLDPDTTTLPELIEALIASGIMGEPVLTIPVNTSAPVVSGAVVPGDDATTTNGTWTQNPTAYEYKWQEFLDPTWTDVSGETGNTYTNMPAGEYRSAVRAGNSAGWSDWAYSSAFVVAEPGSGLVFDGPASANANVTGAMLQHSGTGGPVAVAWVDAPLTGKVYMEFDVYIEQEEAAICFTGNSNRSTSDSTVVFLAWNSPNAGVMPGFWSLFARANYGMSTNEYASNIHTYGTEQGPTIRIGIHVDTATRRFWIRDVTLSQSGDPAAGTGHQFVLNGTDPIYVGASLEGADTIEIVAPDNHTHAPAAGFTAI